MTTIVAAPATTVSLTPTIDNPQIDPRPLTERHPTSHAVSAPPNINPRREDGTDTPRSNASNSPETSHKTGSDGKLSPNSLRTTIAPMIKVKKEPSSPNTQPQSGSARPRPRRLDLTASMSTSRGPQTGSAGRPSAPLTSKESAGLAIKDMGIACLSPGFQTQDPSMREQLQRSLDVREQQRQLIEARQKGQGSARPALMHNDSEPVLNGHNHSMRPADSSSFGMPARTPSISKRKGPPPGLSISAPSAAQFANERVIQSAPLHQSFTGLRPGGNMYQPSNLSQTSHIHHVPATQTNNRLPPIADVFAAETLAAGPASASLRPGFAAHPTPHNHPTPSQHPGQHSPGYQPPLRSPGFPSQQPSQQPQSQQPERRREFRSAEEAVANMAGGREDLLPKIVHYGGPGPHQPPTPPSPLPPNHPHHAHSAQYHASATQPTSSAHFDPARVPSSGIGRRRGRDEYERDNGSPEEGNGEYKRSQRKMQPESFGSVFMSAIGAGVEALGERDEAGRNRWKEHVRNGKKEDFLRLCEMVWDLFHD